MAATATAAPAACANGRQVGGQMVQSVEDFLSEDTGDAPRLGVPVDMKKLQALRQDPELAEFASNQPLLIRYLCAFKEDLKLVREKLCLRKERFKFWNTIGLNKVEEAEVDALLDGRLGVPGYWQIGGEDVYGRQSCWLFQNNARPCTDLHGALVGVKAAHKFFNAIASDEKSLTTGFNIIVMLKGVSALQLTTDILKNYHSVKVGNYFKGCVPINFNRLIFVGCGFGIESMARLITKQMEIDAKDRLEFVPDLKDLEQFGLHQTSWPASLRREDGAGSASEGPPPLEMTSQWCTARILGFDRELEMAVE